MEKYIVLFILFIAGIVLSRGVKHLSWLSLGQFGVRKIRRWNAYTDSFANFILFLCFIFCCTYWLIPFSFWIYSVILLLTTLITMSRVNFIKQTRLKYPRWAAFCFFLVGMIGWFSVADSAFFEPIYQLQKDVLAYKIDNVLYFLQEVNFMYAVLQGFLMWVPLWFLWNHFKTMRTDHCLRSHNIVTFTLKVVFVCGLLLGLSIFGFGFLDVIYQKNHKLRLNI